MGLLHAIDLMFLSYNRRAAKKTPSTTVSKAGLLDLDLQSQCIATPHTPCKVIPEFARKSSQIFAYPPLAAAFKHKPVPQPQHVTDMSGKPAIASSSGCLPPRHSVPEKPIRRNHHRAFTPPYDNEDNEDEDDNTCPQPAWELYVDRLLHDTYSISICSQTRTPSTIVQEIGPLYSSQARHKITPTGNIAEGFYGQY